MGRILTYIAVDKPLPDWATAVRAVRERFNKLSLSTDAEWLEFARSTYREGTDGQLHFDWDVDIIKPILKPQQPPADLWPLWRGLGGCPTLAIRGGVSDILSAATLERMAAEKPDLLQLTVPNVGHVPSLAEPGVPEAIDDFLSRF